LECFAFSDFGLGDIAYLFGNPLRIGYAFGFLDGENPIAFAEAIQGWKAARPQHLFQHY